MGVKRRVFFFIFFACKLFHDVSRVCDAIGLGSNHRCVFVFVRSFAQKPLFIRSKLRGWTRPLVDLGFPRKHHDALAEQMPQDATVHPRNESSNFGFKPGLSSQPRVITRRPCTSAMPRPYPSHTSATPPCYQVWVKIRFPDPFFRARNPEDAKCVSIFGNTKSLLPLFNIFPTFWK